MWHTHISKVCCLVLCNVLSAVQSSPTYVSWWKVSHRRASSKYGVGRRFLDSLHHNLSLSIYLSLCLSLRGKELDKEKEKAVKSGGHCVHTSFFLWAFFCQVWSHRFSLVLLFALLFSGFAFAVAFSQLLRILFSKTRRRGRRGGGREGEGNDSVRRVRHHILQADYYASFFMFFAMRERRNSCVPC